MLSVALSGGRSGLVRDIVRDTVAGRAQRLGFRHRSLAPLRSDLAFKAPVRGDALNSKVVQELAGTAINPPAVPAVASRNTGSLHRGPRGGSKLAAVVQPKPSAISHGRAIARAQPRSVPYETLARSQHSRVNKVGKPHPSPADLCWIHRLRAALLRTLGRKLGLMLALNVHESATLLVLIQRNAYELHGQPVLDQKFEGRARSPVEITGDEDEPRRTPNSDRGR